MSDSRTPPSYDIIRKDVNLYQLTPTEQQMLASGEASIIRGWRDGQAYNAIVRGDQPDAHPLTAGHLGTYADQYFTRLGKSDAQLGITRPGTSPVTSSPAATSPVPSQPVASTGTRLASPTTSVPTPMAANTPTATTTPTVAGASYVPPERPPGTPVTEVRAQNQLIRDVQDTMSRSTMNQQTLLNRYAGVGREAILSAAPELGQVSERLMQQVQDPLGGGFGADIAERIRVQQAAAGLSQGGQAAFQEAATVARAGEERRLGAATQLQALGGSFLQQLGLGQPLVADLAGIGQFQLASQSLAASQAAGLAQSEISKQIYQQVSSFLQQRETNRINQLNLGTGYGPYGYGTITGVTTGQGAAL